MTHKNTPNPESDLSPHSATDAPHQGVSRRGMLDLAAKAGATAIALGAVASLTGCGGTAAQRRVKTKGGSVGQPIPSDPIAISRRPSPVHTPSYTPSVTTNLPLSAIPSFVIPRNKWTSAEPIRRLADPMNRVTKVTVHHDAIMPVPSGAYADSLRRMQAIRSGHLGNGWADIGYHFAVDPTGRIWQARPLELQGAHVKDHNPGNLGVVVFGNYEQMRPTQASLEAVNKIVAYAMERFNIPMSQVRTHKELRPTACPGRHLQEQMNRTRAAGGRLAQLVRQTTSHS